MAVIARDAVARDHLVYAWPLPIGPEDCEVTCSDSEEVVMCPAWMVGDRLGPGRHHWRSPDPTRPVSAFFVSTAPVSAQFDMTTAFMIPNTGQPIRLRATGSLQIRCADAGLLIAQFVGLPFDAVNEGVLRSVSRSIERMLARLLTRRVIMAGTPMVVTDPVMLPNIIEELVAYNPTAGAVFGVELIAMMHMVIGADDGNGAYVMLPNQPDPNVWREDADHNHVHTNGNNGHGMVVPLAAASGEISMNETSPGKRNKSATLAGPHQSGEIPTGVTSGEIGGSSPKPQRDASSFETTKDSSTSSALAGEIVARPPLSSPALPSPPILPPHGSYPPIEVPRSPDEVTQPGVPTPVPGSLTLRGLAMAEPPKEPKNTDDEVTPAPKVRSSAPSIPPPIPAAAVRHIPPPELKAKATSTLTGLGTAKTEPPPVALPVIPAVPPVVAPVAKPSAEPKPEVPDEARGSIMGIGMTAIGATSAAGEIPTKVPPGSRVLVPGPNGLMQSATVRQLLQGYYELEVGSSGETIWVPVNGVVPE